MDKERLLYLADVLEKGNHSFAEIHAAFNMDLFFMSEVFGSSISPYLSEIVDREDIKDPYKCNTVACIAGFACLLFDYQNTKPNSNHLEVAKKVLDLTQYQAAKLFLGAVSPSITGPDAAGVIRNFVETGMIDWNEVIKKHDLNPNTDISHLENDEDDDF